MISDSEPKTNKMKSLKVARLNIENDCNPIDWHNIIVNQYDDLHDGWIGTKLRNDLVLEEIIMTN